MRTHESDDTICSTNGQQRAQFLETCFHLKLNRPLESDLLPLLGHEHLETMLGGWSKKNSKALTVCLG